MQNTSNTYKTKIVGEGRTFCPLILVNGKEYKKFIGFKKTASINYGDTITIGASVSSTINVTLCDIQDGEKFVDKPLVAKIGLQISEGNFEYVKLGSFVITEAIRDDTSVKITAVDNFYLTTVGFFTELKGAQKIKAILDEQCKKIGISFAGGADDVSVDVSKLDGLTIREVIQLLASYCGKNAVMNADGNLEFRWYKESGVEINASRFSDPLNLDDKDTFINKLECGIADKESIVLGTGIGISFNNSLVDEARLQVLYDRIKGFTYRACTLHLTMGQPELEVGDIITVVDKKGNRYKVPVMKLTVESDGGCWCEIEAVSKSESKSKFNIQGTLSTKVDRAYSESIATKELVAQKVTAWEGEFETITTNYLKVEKKITAAEAEIKTIKSDYVQTGTLNTKLALIEEALMGKATIKDLDAIKANIEELTTKKANIDDLNALSIKVNELVAGSITTDYLETNYAKIDLANIKDGCITTAMIGEGVIGNVQIADGSITDAKIVGLTANKITAGKLDAAEIEVINLNCANLTVGTINGQQIAPGAIDLSKLDQALSGTITTTSEEVKQALIDAGLAQDTADGAQADATKALEDALRAYQEAQAAKQAAGSAQTSADGKNSVYYKPTPPTGTFKVGDTWFNTAQDNAMSYWDGVQWKKQEFGAGALENDAVTADKIAQDVNQKIADAFANAGMANDKIDNLEIGGRNLIRNSDFSNGKQYWNLGNSTCVVETDAELGTCLKFSHPSAGDISANRVFTAFNHESGKTYTLSFYAKSASNTTIRGGFVYGLGTYSTTSKWKKYVYTYTVPSDKRGTLTFYCTVANVDVWITKVKVEEGNISTGHTIAPEDIDSAITDVKTTADSAKQDASTAKTDASSAKTTADAAKQLADTAKTISDAAKKAAEDTAKDLTTLDGKLTTVESTVTKNTSNLTTQGGKISALESVTTETNKQVTAVKGEMTTAKQNITTLQTNYSSLDSSLKGLTVTVGQHTSSINTVTKTVTDNKSNWDKAATALTTATDAKNKIDNLAIGGRNLALGTTKPRENLRNCDYSISAIGYEKTKYTVSFYAKAQKATTANVYVNDDTGQTRWNFYFASSVPITTEYKKFVFTADSPKEYYGAVNSIVIRVYGMATDSLLSVKNLKLEKGTKDTDHSPAPEDIDTRITAEIKTVTDKQATFQTTLEGITGRVSSVETTTTTVKNTVDANKANWDKAVTALNTANAVNSTVNNNKANWDKAVTALTTANDAKSKIDGLQIGGRNYIILSKLSAYGSYNSVPTYSGDVITTKWASSYTGNILTLMVSGFTPKTAVYTLSGYLKVNGKIPTSKYFTGYASTYGSALTVNTYDATTGYFVITQKYSSSSGWIIHAPTTRASGSTDTVTFEKLKFEEGNRDTSHSPAPEDIDNRITTEIKTVTDKQSALELTVNQFKTTVSSTYATKTEVSTVDGKFASYATTSAMNSAITAKANEITSNVSKTYATQTTVNTINGNVTALTNRMSSAESKITDSAIVSTVTKSSSWSTLNSNANSALSKANSLIDLTTIKDTRSDNQNPQWYFTNYARKSVKEFKYCTTVGISGEGGGYGTLVTDVSWSEQSGGYPTQLFYPNNSQNIYRRVGTSNTAWSAWIQVAGSHNIVSTINQTAESIKISASKIDLSGYVTITNIGTAGKTVIDGGNVKTGTITATQIASNAITAVKIAGRTITADKLVAKTLTAASGVFADACIVTANIANLAVTSAKIANLAVGNAQIANAAITTAKIANLSITNALIANGAIDNAKIANLDAGKITTGTISADRIAAGSIVLGKLDSTTQGVVNVSKTQQANHGYRYRKDIVINGDSKKYYPVVLRGGNQDAMREIFIARGYSEQAPSDWNTATHHGGLTLKIKCNFGGWGGANYSWFIHDLEETYCTMFAGAGNVMSNIGFAIFLRGGGTTGAVYHMYSDQPLEVAIYNGTSPQICYNSDLIGWSGGTAANPTYKWNAPAPRTAPSTSEINPRIYAKVAQSLDSTIATWCYNNDRTYINGGKLYTGTVTATQIAANAIVAGKIATNAVTAGTIVAGAVSADKLAANAVTAGKIAANAVTTATIAAGAVNADKISSNAILAKHISAGVITGDKLVAATITGAKIAARTIAANNIVAGAITAAEIKSGTITATQIASGTITATQLASNSVTAVKIAAKAITADKLNVTSLSSITANIGAITSGSINIGGGKFVVNSSGALTATSANISGTITATSGSVGGWAMDATRLYKQQVMNWPKFVAADYEKIKNYINGYVTLTAAEKEKYDIFNDGKVNAQDYVIVKQMSEGNLPTTTTVLTELNSSNPKASIKISSVAGAFVGNVTAISPFGISTERINTGTIYASGDITCISISSESESINVRLSNHYNLKMMCAGETITCNLYNGSSGIYGNLRGAKAYMVQCSYGGNGQSTLVMPDRYSFIKSENNAGGYGIYVIIYSKDGSVYTSSYQYDGTSKVTSITPIFW